MEQVRVAAALRWQHATGFGLHARVGCISPGFITFSHKKGVITNDHIFNERTEWNGAGNFARLDERSRMMTFP